LQRESFCCLDGRFQVFTPHFRLSELRLHLTQLLFDLFKFRSKLSEIVVKWHWLPTLTVPLPSYMGWIPHIRFVNNSAQDCSIEDFQQKETKVTKGERPASGSARIDSRKRKI